MERIKTLTVNQFFLVFEDLNKDKPDLPVIIYDEQQERIKTVRAIEYDKQKGRIKIVEKG